jgi:hypothetical protein
MLEEVGHHLHLDQTVQQLVEQEQTQHLEMEDQEDLVEDQDQPVEDHQDQEYQVKEIQETKVLVVVKAVQLDSSLQDQDIHTQLMVVIIHKVADMVTTQVLTHNQLTQLMVDQEEEQVEQAETQVLVL